MLTSKWIVALLMLFLLTPVSKLIRRFIYAMVEQFDRGDPATEARAGAKAGALKTMGTIAAAGAVGFAGGKGIKDIMNRGKNNPGKDGGSRPPNVGGKTNGTEDPASITGGYLPETRHPNGLSSNDLSSVSRSSYGTQRKTLVDSHGNPIQSKGEIKPTASGRPPIVNAKGEPLQSSGGMSQGTMQETGGTSVPTDGATSKPTVFDRAGKWGRAGGKTLAVVGGIASTAVGMGVAAFAGSQMGHAVAHHGTHLAHHAGKISGGAIGGTIHGGHRAVQHTVSGYRQARAEGRGMIQAMGRGTHQTYQKAEAKVSDQWKNRGGSFTPAFTSPSSTVSVNKGTNSGFPMNTPKQLDIDKENRKAGWQQFVMDHHKKSDDDDIPFDY